MSVVLRGYTDADLPLTLALETDADTMAELGGPRPRAAVEDVHVRRLDEPLWKVVADADTGEALGTIGAWETEHDGEAVWETGWMLLPAARGRGAASGALERLVALARERGIDALHAFPGVTNAASNRLCDRFGFTDEGVLAFDFGGRELRCNHRVLALASTG